MSHSKQTKKGFSLYLNNWNPSAKKYINICYICGHQGYSPVILEPIYYLHEMSEFNESAYWEYYNSIIEITNVTKEMNYIKREILDIVCHTYDYIIRSVMWHYHPEDLYIITNLPLEIQSYIERLEFAFIGFRKGQVYDETRFELENPMFR